MYIIMCSSNNITFFGEFYIVSYMKSVLIIYTFAHKAQIMYIPSVEQSKDV